MTPRTDTAAPVPSRSTADAAPETLARAETVRMLYAHRVVLFTGELDDALGTEVIARLAMLSRENPRADIHLWIQSPGGSVPMMLAIADTIAAIPNDVSTLALGWAASAGQFVLSMGTPGKRLALPHARILLHQGSSGIGGAAADVELQAGDLRRVRDTVLGEIARVTGQPQERVFEDSLRDRWFSAEEAVDYGLCDRIADGAGLLP
ncbi:ClpP family protease [Sediminivirga luteola]|uniref:ClpP family protease n=1 Tax=Sediminivirga luteola TaxID=1774748 RepID=UPI003BB4EC3E